MTKSSVSFIYLYLCTCPVNQLPIVQPPSFIRIQKLYPRNQQSLHSRNINLCWRWPHCEQPGSLRSLTCLPTSNLRGRHENFFFGFIFRLDIEGLLVLDCCTPLYVALWILHVSHAFQGSDEQNLLSFVGCSQGSDSKSSVAIPPSLSIQVSWMEVYSEIYEKVCRVIVNRCYERHKEIRSLDIHCFCGPSEGQW